MKHLDIHELVFKRYWQYKGLKLSFLVFWLEGYSGFWISSLVLGLIFDVY